MAHASGEFNVGQYSAAVEAFNHDDLGPLAEMFAEKCDFGPAGNTRDEIIENLRAGRAAGWTKQTILALMGAGEFGVTLYRNTFADGSSLVGAGVLRVDQDGKLLEIRTLDQPLGAG
jgi:hypothetical protein